MDRGGREAADPGVSCYYQFKKKVGMPHRRPLWGWGRLSAAAAGSCFEGALEPRPPLLVGSCRR